MAADAGALDASDALDASPVEGNPDGTPEQTLSFGERDSADFSGVTSDSYIRVDLPNNNYSDDDRIRIDANPIQVAVVRFDVKAIPPETVILAASVDFEVGNPIESGGYQFFELAESWDADQVTWNQRTSNVPWSSPGAAGQSSRNMVLQDFAPRSGGSYTVSLPASLVQRWVDNPNDNHGFKIVSVSATGRGGTMVSSEGSRISERPLLRVTYRL